MGLCCSLLQGLAVFFFFFFWGGGGGGGTFVLNVQQSRCLCLSFENEQKGQQIAHPFRVEGHVQKTYVLLARSCEMAFDGCNFPKMLRNASKRHLNAPESLKYPPTRFPSTPPHIPPNEEFLSQDPRLQLSSEGEDEPGGRMEGEEGRGAKDRGSGFRV